MKRSDKITAAAAVVTLIGYLGLVATGTVEPDVGPIEALLAIALSALGYDSWADWVEDATDNIDDLVEELDDEEIAELVERAAQDLSGDED